MHAPVAAAQWDRSADAAAHGHRHQLVICTHAYVCMRARARVLVRTRHLRFALGFRWLNGPDFFVAIVCETYCMWHCFVCSAVLLQVRRRAALRCAALRSTGLSPEKDWCSDRPVGLIVMTCALYAIICTLIVIMSPLGTQAVLWKDGILMTYLYFPSTS